MSWIELTRSWVEVVGTVVTTVAVLVGAWWFFVRRANIRKANISHKVTFVAVGDEFYMNVQVRVKNSGHRQIIVDGAQAAKGLDWVNTVLVEEVSPFLESNSADLLAETAEFGLLPLDAKAFPGKLVIEPDEERAVVFDFMVPKTSQVVRVYSRISNGYNGGGWSTVTVHKVVEE